MLGNVVTDIDIVHRVYGAAYRTDPKGRFRMLECKLGDAGLTTGQAHTYKLMDEIWRQGDLEERYDGLYIVKTSTVDWDNEPSFTVNKVRLSQDEFIGWLNNDGSVFVDPLHPVTRAARTY